MAGTVCELILVLDLFFPQDLPFRQALYILGVIIALYSLLCLHLNQRREARQPTRTTWFISILGILAGAFKRQADDPVSWFPADDQAEEYAGHLAADLDGLYSLLRLRPENRSTDPDPPFTTPTAVLCTNRRSCVFCPMGDLNIIPTLRRRDKRRTVWLLDASFRWVQTNLRLEYDTEYLRVSKNGTWVARRVAVCQEKALNRFHLGWSNFADWLNDLNTTAMPHPSTRILAESVRAAVGINGGVIPSVMSHGCMDCIHLKRYKSDLLAEGAVLGGGVDVAGFNPEATININEATAEEAPAFQFPEQQDAPPQGFLRGGRSQGACLHSTTAVARALASLTNINNFSPLAGFPGAGITA
ncbi:hypothetical protein DFH09DRAFT_1068893 [Mycena vulgaris]|nr:hypothetical protein DFH09DRAFT_1068893 [Mycena vulgaris]